MTTSSAEEQRLRDLRLLRRVKDRIDREYAQPLDVEALARGVHMSAGHLSREFKKAYGESPYSYLMTRRIERAMRLLRRGRPERHRRLLRGRLPVAGHLQHPVHRAGRRAAERLQAAGRAERRRACRRAWPSRSPDRSGRSIRKQKRVGRAPPSVLGMDLKIHSAFLPHDDRDAAVAFYCDTLGFELRNDVGYNGMHWLTVGPPDQPDVNLVLFPPGADPGVTDDERRTITEMMAKGTYAMLTLATDDLDALFEKLQASDAEVMQEPTDQHYGVRDCAFRDPSGNMIRIDEVKCTMKTMTCQQLGGACDLQLRGETADERDQGPGQAPPGGGRRRRQRPRAGPEAMKGRWKHPHQGDGLVQGHQAGVRRPARGLSDAAARTTSRRIPDKAGGSRGDAPADSHDLIRVHGARVNNLKDVSVELPKRRLTAFTGVSGSGKSSLVFGTIAAESQRMINETYSAFVQGFMPTLARPEVDLLEGLTTAIIVDQERMGANPRSTVGTATDANAMLRILFSRIGDAARRPADGVLVQRPDPRRERRDEDREGRPAETERRPQGRLPGRHVPALRGHGRDQRLRPHRDLRRDEVARRGRAARPRLQHGRLVRPDLQRRRPRHGQADRQVHRRSSCKKLLYGEPEKIKVEGVNLTYEGVLTKVQKSMLSKDVEAMQPHVRRFVERAVTFTTCPDCDGTRLTQGGAVLEDQGQEHRRRCARCRSATSPAGCAASTSRRWRRCSPGCSTCSTRSPRSGSATSRSTARPARCPAERRSAPR